MNASISPGLDAQIVEAERAVQQRDERVRREVATVEVALRGSRSKLLLAAGVVGLIALGVVAGRARGPRRGSRSRSAAPARGWIVPLAFAVLRSPLTAHLLSRATARAFGPAPQDRRPIVEPD
jgi:hypothetical protein